MDMNSAIYSAFSEAQDLHSGSVSIRTVTCWVLGLHLLVLLLIATGSWFSWRTSEKIPVLTVTMIDQPAPAPAAQPAPSPTQAAPPEPVPPQPVPAPTPPVPAPAPAPTPKPASATPKPAPKPVTAPAPKPKKPAWTARRPEDIRKSALKPTPVSAAPATPAPAVPTVSAAAVASRLQAKVRNIALQATNTGSASASQTSPDYLAAVGAFLRQRWHQPTRMEVSGANPSVTVFFRVRGDGSVSSSGIVRNSGVAAMDRSVAALLRDVKKLPAPRGTMNTAAEVRLQIVFQLD